MALPFLLWRQWGDCEMAEGLFLEVEGGEAVKTRYGIPETGAIVGRGAACDITVNDATVSTKHCQILLDGDSWVVKDLGSHNGTQVNGAKATVNPIRDGDVLTLGRYSFRVGQDNEPRPTSKAPLPSSTEDESQTNAATATMAEVPDSPPLDPGNDGQMTGRGFAKGKAEIGPDTMLVDVTTGKEVKFSDLPEDVQVAVQERNSQGNMWNAPPLTSQGVAALYQQAEDVANSVYVSSSKALVYAMREDVSGLTQTVQEMLSGIDNLTSVLEQVHPVAVAIGAQIAAGKSSEAIEDLAALKCKLSTYLEDISPAAQGRETKLEKSYSALAVHRDMTEMANHYAHIRADIMAHCAGSGGTATTLSGWKICLCLLLGVIGIAVGAWPIVILGILAGIVAIAQRGKR